MANKATQFLLSLKLESEYKIVGKAVCLTRIGPLSFCLKILLMKRFSRIHPTPLLLCLHLLWVTTSSIAASGEITFECLQPSTEDTFFHQPDDWAPIYTDSAELEIRGSIVQDQTDFLLLQINQQFYPLDVVDGAFSKIIPLKPGENKISISSNKRIVKPILRKVFRVRPASIDSVVSVVEGGNRIEVPFTVSSAAHTHLSATLSSPVIMIMGTKGTAEVTELKVKDNYNNTLPVESLSGNRFAIHYTLRNDSAILKFSTTLEGRPLQKTNLELKLQNMVQLDFDSDKNPRGWVFKGTKQNHPVTQLDKFVLAGSVASIKNGEIELILQEEQSIVPVRNHLFEVDIPLEMNDITRGRVRMRLNGQTFFESFQIEQKEPVVQVEALKQIIIDGSLHLSDAVLKPRTDAPLELREGLLRLQGNAKFLNGLSLKLVSLKSQSTIASQQSAGAYRFEIPLPVGRHSFSLMLEGGGFSRPYYSFEVNVLPAIEVDAVNHIPYRSGKMELSKPELLLRGSVHAVKRGLLQLHLGNETYPISVLNGRFQMDKAVPIPDGTSEMSLRLQSNDLLFEQHFDFTVIMADPHESEIEPKLASGDAKKSGDQNPGT